MVGESIGSGRVRLDLLEWKWILLLLSEICVYISGEEKARGNSGDRHSHPTMLGRREDMGQEGVRINAVDEIFMNLFCWVWIS